MKLYNEGYPICIVAETKEKADYYSSFISKGILSAKGFICVGEYQELKDFQKGIPLYFSDPISAFNYLDTIPNNTYMHYPNYDFRYHFKSPLPLYLDNLKEERNNVIQISENALRNICGNTIDLLNEHKITIEELIDEDKMPFKSFTLKIDKANTKINYSYEDSHIVSSTLTHNGYLVSKRKIYSTYESILLENYGDDESEMPNGETEYLLFWILLFYIKNLPATYNKSDTKEIKAITTGKSYNTKTKHITYVKTNYVFKDKITKTYIKHIFKCLCWGVRGHYRHYQNGKTIFIAEYRKGKERKNGNIEQHTTRIN